jgi:predicted lipid-binding transport protein (Tim44 family)
METTNGFITAYRNIIGAFADKDLPFLSQNLEPNLLKNTIIP